VSWTDALLESTLRRNAKRAKGLDGWGQCGCMTAMKTTISAILIGAVLLGLGCISTVNDRHRAGFPFVKDKFQARYERPVDQVFEAAKAVLADNGVPMEAAEKLNQSATVKIVEGKVNQRHVWIRIEAVDPKLTEVTVQVRTSAGGTDLDLTAELGKQIALKLK
jgi:hypothetical protein